MPQGVVGPGITNKSSGGSTPGTITLSGDVTGQANANHVVKVQGHAVTSTAPLTHQVWIWTVTTSKMVAKPIFDVLGAGAGITLTTAAGITTISVSSAITIVTKATSWTAALTTAGKLVNTTKATALAVTIKKTATIAWPTGTILQFSQGAAGQLTVTAGATVTLQVRSAFTAKTAGEYATITAIKIAANTWRLLGDLT
jgi:hypothetical protein